jgi:hypothetical protein
VVVGGVRSMVSADGGGSAEVGDGFRDAVVVVVVIVLAPARHDDPSRGRSAPLLIETPPPNDDDDDDNLRRPDAGDAASIISSSRFVDVAVDAAAPPRRRTSGAMRLCLRLRLPLPPLDFRHVSSSPSWSPTLSSSPSRKNKTNSRNRHKLEEKKSCGAPLRRRGSVLTTGGGGIRPPGRTRTHLSNGLWGPGVGTRAADSLERKEKAAVRWVSIARDGARGGCAVTFGDFSFFRLCA